MEKTIYSKKHTLIKVTLTVILMMFAFAFALTQAFSFATRAHAEGDAVSPYAFKVDTGSFQSGSYVSITGENFPVFKLTFDDVSDAVNKGFWYGTSDIDDVNTVEDWNRLESINDTAHTGYVASQGLATIYLADFVPSLAVEGFYHKFMFFRAGAANLEVGDYDDVDQRVEVGIDVNSDANKYKISSLTATYTAAGGVSEEYNLNNASKVWVSSDITIRVRTSTTNVDNTNFYYQLGENAPVAFKVENIAVEGSDIAVYEGVAVVTEGLDDYEGEIKIYSTSKTDKDTKYFYDSSNTHNIYYDNVAPKFELKATTLFEGTPIDYYNETWACNAIEYTLDTTSVISGAEYNYSVTYQDADGNYQTKNGLVSRKGDKLTYTVEYAGMSSITFHAISNSGKEYSYNVTAYIDYVRPQISVKATDANSVNVLTKGATVTSGSRVGYASNSLTFNVTNVNEASQKIGNTVSYFYKVEGGEYEEITVTNDNHLVEVANTTATLIDTTYYFKIQSLSGYESEYAFTFTILDSDFATSMEIQDYYENGAGWIKEPVTVNFTLPIILGIEDEYAIHGFIIGDTTTDEVLPQTLVEEKDGYGTFAVDINRNLNGQRYVFYVVDKAGNKVEYFTDAEGNKIKDEDENDIPLRTPQLKLDLTTPTAKVVTTIGNNIEINPGDWSAGEVIIKLIPDALISGISCYPVIAGNPSLTPMSLTNGAYSTKVDVSGEYVFRLVSGSGIYADFVVPVNIDSTDIEFTSIIANTEDKNGNYIEEVNVADEDLMIANNLRVQFMSNHQGHFVFYYAIFTGDAPNLNDSAYTRVDDAEELLIKLPEDGNKAGALKYAFYLESKAQDTSGAVSRSAVKYIDVSYDVRDFEIIVYYQGGAGNADEWVGTAPSFTLNLNQSGLEETVTIKKYQYRLSLNGEWRDIEGAITENSIGFVLDGNVDSIKKYYNEAERSSDTLNDESAFASFNGTIYFRALNAAGHASPVKPQAIKMDTSTPSPLYGIKHVIGESVGTGTDYNYYSNQSISYVPQGYVSDETPSDFFINKAPITYYYAAYTDTREDSNISWTQLTNEVVLNGDSGTYVMKAINSLGVSSKVYTITFNVEDPKDAPTAEITSGGNPGAITNVLETNWAAFAKIQFKVTSLTDYYLWYSLDDGQWLNAHKHKSAIPSSTEYPTITFSAEDSEDLLHVKCNMKQTVRFKITNLAGSEYLVTKAVIIRIDQKSPKFNLTYSTATKGQFELDETAWYSEAIVIGVSPKEENPGGVEYTYRVEGGTYNFEKFAGNSFSTDNVIDFAGNGTLTITIRAVSSANLKTETTTITLNIDKVVPTFDLIGEAYAAAGEVSVSKGNISSGTWTNADEVLISRKNAAKNASKVTYTYYFEENPSTGTVWNGTSAIRATQITTLVVTATSEAGLTYENKFAVKIDNVDPVIDAGIIHNNVDDPKNPYSYYIDQVIHFTEANLKEAKYNNFPLSDGAIIATNSVDNSNGGYVHIVVEDLAGNKAELTFYMTVFPLTVNTIELCDDHEKLLNDFERDYLNAKATLTDSRSQYFATTIGRLRDRLATLAKEIDDYQGYLEDVNEQITFNLVSDYPVMEKYLSYFISEDVLIVYPKWQQDKIREGIYGSYYNKLVAEYSELNALMTVVRDLQKKVIALPATNIVEESDYQDVIRLYNAYQSLSTDQKAVFKSNLLNKLLELKRICEVYLLQDEDTGISVDGDHLVGETTGLKLEVLNYAESTELFSQAQKTLYETVSPGKPRKIISINKLSFTGYGSQYDTGEIVVTLPIPTEGEIDYTDYVYFAVYRLSADGTLAPVKNVMRARDGKSVYFSTTSVETYVLATTANVVVREEDEKVYGSIGGIEIDATLLTYITFSVVGMFVVFVVIMLLVALRRRKFLRAYNRDHKNALVRKGITRIPKGNAPPPSNPARPEERVGNTKSVYFYGKRRK